MTRQPRRTRYGRMFSPRRRSATPCESRSRRQRRVKLWRERFRRFSRSAWQSSRIVRSVCALFRISGEAARAVRAAKGAHLVAAGDGRQLRLERLEQRRLLTTTPWNLAAGDFLQDWSNNNQITQDEDWSSVPSIVGYVGTIPGAVLDVDPQTILSSNLGNPNVIANQINPNITFGGVAEFHATMGPDSVANFVVALQPTNFADAPNLVLYMNSTGRENVSLSYNLRDIDIFDGGDGVFDDAVQQVALQYRIGATGDFINVPAGYLPDASVSGNVVLETQMGSPTPISLPEWSNQPHLEFRIITSNATGNDEWIGIDDILVTSTPISANTPPAVENQSFQVAEDDDGSAPFATAVATDAESGVTFHVTGGTGVGLFTLDPNTGDLTLATVLDYESGVTSYTLDVEVTDADGLNDSATITIDVTDVNDVAPVVDPGQSAAIDENSLSGRPVLTLSAMDGDVSPTTFQNWTIVDGGPETNGDSNPAFVIDPGTGAISVNDPIDLDFELAPSFTLSVTVFDGINTSAPQDVVVTLNDVDEFDVTTPADVDGGSNEVAENAAVDTPVGITAFAQDQDGTNNTVTYSLSDDAGGSFQIDPNSGVVSVAEPGIDFETATSHNITVRATSADGSTADQSFSISVLDVDEFDVTMPMDVDAAADEVAENAAVGTPVGITALAQDADGSNNTVNYLLADDAGGLFKIDASTGVVSVAVTALDFETATSHNITIQADSSDGSTNQWPIIIAVLDVNEFDVTTPVDNDAAANEVAENAPVGTPVGITAFAQDQDGTNDSVAYSLVDDAGGLFKIESSTGVVTVAAATIDYETATNHNITVRATGTDGSTADQAFAISVLPLNDNAPTLTSTNAPLVEEDTTLAVSVTAMDADSPPQSITFSITGGADSASFTLVGNDLVFVAPPNFEVPGDADGDNIYLVEVTADDSNGMTTTQMLSVTVTNASEQIVVDESVFAAAGGEVSVKVSGGELIVFATGDESMTPLIPPHALASVTDLVVTGRDGADDTLTVDFSGGNPIPTGGISHSGGAGGSDALVVLGSGSETGTYTPDAADSGAGTVSAGGRTIMFTGLEPVDLTGFATITIASPPNATNALVVDAGIDHATGTIPAVVVSGNTGEGPTETEAAHLYNNANVVLDTSATTGGANTITVNSAIGLGHNNTNLTLKTNAQGTVIFDADVAAAGTITLDTPTVGLNVDIATAGKATTAAVTTFNVDDAPSGKIQDAIDLATATDTISVLSGKFTEPLVVDESVNIVGQGDAASFIDAAAAFTGIAVLGGFMVDVSGIALSNYGSTGLHVEGDLTLSGSTLDGGLVGIWVDGGVLDMATTLVNHALVFGVQVSDGGQADISDSEITSAPSAAAGVVVSDGHADVTGTKLSGSNRGLLVNMTGTATVTHSDLSGNAIGGVVNATATTVDSPGNWWGTNSESGVNAAAVGLVDFTPYLHSGTDTRAARGFQADISHVHVTALGEQTGATARIQEGINRVEAGGTVDVHAGTYTELVTVNKTVNLRGEQAGVDARTRSAVPETIVNGPGGSFSLQADGIVLDGFTVKGTTGAPLGTGIHASSLFSGYQIRNNIIQDNTIGLYLGSSGDTRTVVEQNLIRDNNNPGAAGGIGIYSDQGLTNALIQHNKISGDNFTAGINLIGALSPVTSVTLSQNEFTDGNQLVLFNVDDSLVDDNDFTGTMLAGSAIFAGGGNDGLTISSNTITDRAGSGISVTDGGFGFGPNSDAIVTGNVITQDVGLLSANSPAARTMINLWQTAGTSSIAGNHITLSGVAFGPNVNAVRGIVLGGAATGDVNVTSNSLDGGEIGTVGLLTLSSLPAGSNVAISANNIYNNDFGVRLNDSSARLNTNNIYDNRVGVHVSSSGRASIVGNVITDNTEASVDVDAGAALFQDNVLTGSGVGIRAQNDAVVDAGDLSSSNYTGLGSSSGGNILMGYTGAGGNYAIENFNQDAPNELDVYAQNNNFGSTIPAFIEAVVYHTDDDPAVTQVFFTPAVGNAAPGTVYVDDDWAGTGLGADPDGPAGVGFVGVATEYGVDSFANIQEAINAVGTGATIIVFGGNYDEAVLVNKPGLLLQAEADPDNVPQTEAIVTRTSGANSVVIEVAADGVTIHGFHVVVNRPNSTVGIGASNAATVTFAAGSFDGLVLTNNTITSAGAGGIVDSPFLSTNAAGIALLGNGGVIETVTLTGNTVDLLTSDTDFRRRAVWLREVQADVSGNDLTGAASDLIVQFASSQSGTGVTTIDGNTFRSGGVDITENNSTGEVEITNNQFMITTPTSAQSLLLKNVDAAPVLVQSNTFAGHALGISMGTSSGVTIDDNGFTPGLFPNTADIVLDTHNFTGGTPAAPFNPLTATITNNEFFGAAGPEIHVALALYNRNPGAATPDYGTVTIGGAGAGNTFHADLDTYIYLDPATLGGVPVAFDFDASDNLYEVTTGVAGTYEPSAMTLEQLFELEDKIVHAVDVGSLGLVTVVAGQVFVTQDSFFAPLTTTPSIQRGIGAADAGDTVHVEAGTYSENLTIAKDIKIMGDAMGGTTLTSSVANSRLITVDDAGIFGTADNLVSITHLNLDGATLASQGVFIEGAADLGTFSLTGGDVENFRLHGVYVDAAAYSGSDPSVSAMVGEVNLTDLNFANNGITGVGGTADIQFFGFNNDATLSNLVLVGSRNELAGTGARMGIQFRGTGDITGAGVQPTGNVTLDGIDVSGDYRTQFIGIQRYNDVSSLSFDDVALGGAGSSITGTFGAALRFDGVGDLSTQSQPGEPTVNLGNTYFRGLDTYFNGPNPVFDIEFAPDNDFAWVRAAGTSTRWNTSEGAGVDVSAGSLSLLQAFEVEDRILHYVEPNHPSHLRPFRGFVEIQNGQAFVTDTFGSLINRGIELVDVGGRVIVSTGTFTEDVIVDKEVSLYSESGAAMTTIKGESAGSGAAVRIVGTGDNAALGETGHGFTIVGVGLTGVYINGGATGVTIQDNIIQAATGNDLGIQVTGTASILGNQFDNATADIDVNGGTALVEGNTFAGRIGVRIQNGGVADLGQTDSMAVNFTGLSGGTGPNGASAGNNDFSAYTTAATATDGAVVNLNMDAVPGRQGAPPDVTAFGNFWSVAVPTPNDIENVVWHDRDDNTLGFVDFAALAGDYNQNGVVDAADYTVWQNTRGASVPNFSGADGNSDGVVDQLDYDVWKSNFGNTLSGSGAGSTTVAVRSFYVPQVEAQVGAAEPTLVAGTSVSSTPMPASVAASDVAVEQVPASRSLRAHDDAFAALVESLLSDEPTAERREGLSAFATDSIANAALSARDLLLGLARVSRDESNSDLRTMGDEEELPVNDVFATLDDELFAELGRAI